MRSAPPPRQPDRRWAGTRKLHLLFRRRYGHVITEKILMSLRHRLGTFLVAASCALVSVGASAHAILVDSSPKANGTVAAGHVDIVFKYNSKIDQHRSRMTLVKSDQSETTLTIAANGKQPNELDSGVDLTPGTYTIRWQALALDGHITRGDVPFTVAAKP
ncbi:copper resistance protein CopC [Dyella dinghuensis]|uniref:Copper resistance protein CopC n=2 Tax=Dyella dinghuensis TaxID=1920169 RepID=A0A3S0PFI5_9GAMM|nr:copper resistance protein CopC [Dyella dinghuensis]